MLSDIRELLKEFDVLEVYAEGRVSFMFSTSFLTSLRAVLSSAVLPVRPLHRISMKNL